MVLEAVEDHKRGWTEAKPGFGGERVPRGQFVIEHVMPRKWSSHWPPGEGYRGEADRDRLIHTIGNLTLLTSRLNSKVSNAAWLGADGKREALHAHDVFFLNRDLYDKAVAAWTDDAIRARTDEIAGIVVKIWPVPAGHRSTFSDAKPRLRRKARMADLITAGLLAPGMTLFPRRKKFADRVATLLPDGQVDVDGIAYAKPAAAAAAIAGKPTNGMWFFLIDQSSRRSLRDVWREYLEALAGDVEDDEPEDDGDDEEA
jgi:hypothetical protein